MININKFFLFYLFTRLFIPISLFCLSGCDVFFVKKIDIEKPHDFLQLNVYENNKKTILTTLNDFAVTNNMACRHEQNVILYCEKKPRTLVAFEDRSGFTICLFGIGTSWEQNKFHRIAKTLETTLVNALPNIKLEVSLPEEAPVCLVPQ